MPLFSIIIPVYNVQEYLPACVKSVAEQAGPRDWECLLVDDGSTDSSGALCDAFAAEIPGFQAIHRKNGGLAAARNTGLKAAAGEWVLFLDSDDAMAPGLLAALRTALAEHPGYDWFIGKHREWQPDGTLTEHPGLHLTPGPFESADYAARLRALYAAGHWSVWKYCLRRAWLRAHRQPDDRRPQPAPPLCVAGGRPAASGRAGRHRPGRRGCLGRHAGRHGRRVLAPGPHGRRARRRPAPRLPAGA